VLLRWAAAARARGGVRDVAVDAEQGTAGASPSFNAWISDRCQAYREQNADLVLRIYYNGRVVHAESGEGFAIANPQQGATWDTQVYVFDLSNSFSGCPKGDYYWRLTLVDPYQRSGYSHSQRGGFVCH
jgi:hypothetical protein